MPTLPPLPAGTGRSDLERDGFVERLGFLPDAPLEQLARVMRLAKLIAFHEYGRGTDADWSGALLASPATALALVLDEEGSRLFPADDSGLPPPDALLEELRWQEEAVARLRRAGLAVELPACRPGETPSPDPESESEYRRQRGLFADLHFRRGLLGKTAESLFRNLIERPDGLLDPGTGQLLAFLRLYGGLSDRVDTLPDQYAEWFYRTRLGMRGAPASPDAAVLRIAVPPGTDPFTMEKGTLFSAGKYPDLRYACVAGTPVNTAGIAAVAAVLPHPVPGPYVSVNRCGEYDPESGGMRWLPFHPSPGPEAEATPTLVMIPCLPLEGGKRDISVDIRLQWAGAAEKRAETVGLLLAELPGRVAAAGLFTVEASAETGWLACPDAGLELRDEGVIDGCVCFRVSFSLDASMPSLAAPDGETHGAAREHPCLRLTPTARDSAVWALLAQFETAKLAVGLTVSGMAGMDLTAAGAELREPDAGVAAVFGNEPKRGDDLQISLPEWRSKEPHDIVLSWSWDAPGSLAEYFKFYRFSEIQLAPECRRSENCDWTPAGSAVALTGGTIGSLAFPDSPEMRKARSRRWRIDSGGSLFGFAEYPQLLARAMRNDSGFWRRLRARFRGDVTPETLNPPFLPLWRDFKISYACDAEYDLRRESLIEHCHCRPGVFALGGAPGATLFAHYTQPALALCLDAVPAGKAFPLSLYARIQHCADGGGASVTAWRGAEALCDETGGLTGSGMIRLLVDGAEGGGESGLAWVGAQPGRAPEICLRGLFAQAVRVEEAPDASSPTTERPYPLPAGSIDQLAVEQDADVDASAAFLAAAPNMNVSQPYCSEGGRPPSEAGRGRRLFHRECAHTVRHRGQAVLPDEYERLLMDNFPQAAAALCLPHTDAKLCGDSPGHVTVVALAPDSGARLGGNGDASWSLDPTLPCPADAGLLRAMRTFLAEHASPFAEIDVIDPVFTPLEIRLEAEIARSIAETDAASALRAALLSVAAPWAAAPERARFGLSVRADALKAALQTRPWLRGVVLLEAVAGGAPAPVVLVRDSHAVPDAECAAGSPAGLFYAVKIDIALTYCAGE